MQHEHKFYDRAQVSRRWFAEEFTPVVRILHAADLVGSGTDAEAYLTIARERYRLIRTHEWNDEVIEELQRKFRSSRWRSRSRARGGRGSGPQLARRGGIRSGGEGRRGGGGRGGTAAD